MTTPTTDTAWASIYARISELTSLTLEHLWNGDIDQATTEAEHTAQLLAAFRRHLTEPQDAA